MTLLQEYIYVIRPTRLEMLTTGPTPDEEAIIDQHFAHLQRLTADGVVILAGRTQTTGDDSFGIVIFRATDDTAARTIMEDDPAVKQGVMRAALYPYRIALMRGREE